MPTPSTVFTEMVSTTLRNHPTTVVDGVSKHNALLYRLKKRNKIEVVDGGYEIARPIDYAENETYKRYAGFDTLNTQDSDVITSAKYPFRQINLNITCSGEQLRMNSGKAQMTSLVKSKKANAVRTAANKFSEDVYSDGTATNQINGLANLIQDNGQGTVGGIDSATWTFWRNKFKEMTGTNTAAAPSVANAASLKADMTALYIAQTRGVDKPDLIVMSHDIYALYELGEQQLQRYTDSEMAKAGFESLKFKSADVIFDDNTNFATTAEKAYFLNTDYLKLVQHRQAQWTMDDDKKPTNQDAVIMPMFWMGNLITTQRALQGVLFDAA